MKKIAKWFLVFSICLGLCIPAWADTDYFTPAGLNPADYPAFTEVNDLLKCNMRVGYPSTLADVGPVSAALPTDYPYYFIYWFDGTTPDLADITWSAVAFRIYYSAQPFSIQTFKANKNGNYQFKIIADDDALIKSCYRRNNGDLHGFKTIAPGSLCDDYMHPGVSFVSPTMQVIVDDKVLVPNGGSSDNSYAYDSNIPAPQNLKLDFLETKVGILGLSRRTDLQLSWSNALVDDYSVQISANITTEYTPGEGNQTHGKKTFTHKLVGLSQVDSGGADAGYPASSGKYTITEDELLELAKKEMDKDYAIVERAYVNSFRVQFYKIDSGVINVGPIGVVNLSYSVLGKYQGSTTTTEYPSDSSDIGEGGLMPDDSGKWSGDGSGWEYDEDGNISGSTDGSKPVSWSDALKNLLNGLVNIPTVIASMFESLTSLMSGIGQFPAFFSQVVSWLPPEIASLIGLGIMIVIALRIFGR